MVLGGITLSFHLCTVPDEKPEETKETAHEEENEKTEAREEDKPESKDAGEDGKEKEEKENKQDNIDVDGEAKQTEKRFVLVCSPLYSYHVSIDPQV